MGSGVPRSMTQPLRDEATAEIIRLLPRRGAQFGRLLVRHSHGRFPREMATLLAALEHGTQGITELAAREGFTQSTTTRMVLRLEALGLVERARRASDRRFVAVEITDAGREELRRLRVHWGDALARALAGLSDGEVIALAAASETLERVIDALVATAPALGEAPADGQPRSGMRGPR
jgi:DNA-binding MarR family transcriptional regulator